MSVPPQKPKYSDKTKVARLFNPVVDTKNTEKVAGKIIGDDGEDVENVIRKSFKHVYM